MVKMIKLIFWLVVLHSNYFTAEADDVEILPSIEIPLTVNLVKDATDLCTATETAPTENLDTIINILCHRTLIQRAEIQVLYSQQCQNKILLDEINKKEFHKQVKFLIGYLLMASTSKIYISILSKIFQDNTNEFGTAAGIICALGNQEKTELQNEYPEIVQNLETFTQKGSAEYHQLMMQTCWIQRCQDLSLSDLAAKAEALLLTQKENTDFINELYNLITSNEYCDPNLGIIFSWYTDITGNQLSDKVAKFFQGELQEAVISFVSAVQSTSDFYAKLLNHCLKAPNEDIKLECIDRVITIRCEFDMGTIVNQYFVLFKTKFFADLQASATLDPLYVDSIKQLLGKYVDS